MIRTVGTTVRGIRAPIVKQGDDLMDIVVSSVFRASEYENFQINDRDIIGITESLVARAQGNYATAEDIAQDVENKFPNDIGVVFPILSRNRFSLILKGIALTGKKLYLLLNYPSDEVGNILMDTDRMYKLNINPFTDILTEGDYRSLFGEDIFHPFTGIDYVRLYRDLAIDNKVEIYFANDPTTILKYTQDILVANIHDRKRTRRLLEEAGANIVLGLEDLLAQPKKGRGYNPDYGLLGSNLATESEIKLFPRDSKHYVYEIQRAIKERTGKLVEVLVYGDGAFKDPVCKIWELADPIVSPGYTAGLEGTPHEIKLKYLADTELRELEGEAAIEAIKKKISCKSNNPKTDKESLGTTPRKLTDLLGSLCDLTSGSGDKGTPIVLIQGYFDNFAIG